MRTKEKIQTDKIDIDIDGIGNYLKTKTMNVPKYQRNYAWEEKHVNDLLTDIDNSIYNGEQEYFIGSIVVKTVDNDVVEVVDGQQRLTTASIIIIAIRNYFEKLKDEIAIDITTKYLQSKDLSTRELSSHINLNASDDEFYKNYILSRTPKKVTDKEILKPSHLKLLNALKLATQFVNKMADTTNGADRLVDWVLYIEKNVRVIWVEVPDYSNAFTIFETLNDRGLDLAISDLLKNYIFHKAGNNIEKAQQYWIAMTSILESTGEESIIVPYIRYLWSSMYGNVTEKKLYQSIKNKINSKEAGIDFVKQLSDNSTLYVAILHSDHKYWNEFSTETRNNIRTINLLGMVQVRPLLLSILTNFSKKEIEKTISAIVSMIVRLLIHGTLSSGTFELNFSNAAMNIRKKEITTKEKLFEELKNLVPSNKIFAEDFSKANVSKSTLAKYYLQKIENYKRNKKGAKLVPNNDERIVNLEHILPKKLSDKWNDFDEDSHNFYLNRIGNLTLLGAEDNSTSGHQSFTTKCNYYKDSDFIITKELTKNTNWTTEDINQRQLEFSKIAIECWKI